MPLAICNNRASNREARARMTKISFLVLCFVALASVASAQDDYHKIEVSGGYSIMSLGGVVGGGDVFTDKLTEPLALDRDLATGFPDPFAAIFPAEPFSYLGNRHRVTLQGFDGSVTYNFSKYLGVNSKSPATVVRMRSRPARRR